ncbi:MAG: AAA family ATPase [Candidatus Hodarchaeota archaeon]
MSKALPTGNEIYLESLELENFLSFRKDKISLLKDDSTVSKFCVLTGPNGAGKSSIFQALKFVLGSNSKDGRYNKWEDFIHHGEDYLRVRVIIKAGKKESYEIERFLRKNHTTHFLLNGRPVQARDVNRLLAQLQINPENIFEFIVQGHINAINNLSPKEIYFLIESGIGLGELRKKIEDKARELEILSEEIESLHVQKDTCIKKEAFLKEKLDLLDEKRQLEAEVTRINAEKKWAQKIDIDSKINEKQELLDEKRKSIDSVEKDIEIHEGFIRDHQGRIIQIDELNKEANDEIIRLESEHAKLDEKIKGWNKDKIEQFKKNEEMKKRIENQKISISKLKKEIKAQDEEICAIEKQVAANEKNHEELLEKQETINEKMTKHEDWLNQYNSLNNAVEKAESDKIFQERMLESKESDINNLIKQNQDINAELQEYHWYFSLKGGQNPKAYFEEKIASTERQIETISRNISEKKTDEIDLKRRLGKLLGKGGRNRNVPRQVDDLKRDIKERGLENSIKGPLYEFLEFDPQFSRAIDSVFKKNALLGFVAFDEKDFNLLNSLRNKHKASCFIYYPKKSEFHDLKRKHVDFPGAIDYLINLIKVPKWLEPVVNDIVRDNILVENFSSAVSLIKQDDRAKCVVLDGTMVDSGRYTLRSAPKYHGATILSPDGIDDDQSLEIKLKRVTDGIKDMELRLEEFKRNLKDLNYKYQVLDRIKFFLKQKEILSKKKETLLDQKDQAKEKIEEIQLLIIDLSKQVKQHEEKKPVEFIRLTAELKGIQKALEDIKDENSRLRDQVLEKVGKKNETEAKKLLEDSELKNFLKEHKKLVAEIKQDANDFKETEDKLKSINASISKCKEEIENHDLEKMNLNGEIQKEYNILGEIKVKFKVFMMDLEKINEDISTLEKELAYIENFLKDKGKPKELKTLEEYDLESRIIGEKLASPRLLYITDQVEYEYNENCRILDVISRKLDEINKEMERIMDINTGLKNDYQDKISDFVKELESNINAKFKEISIPFRVAMKSGGSFNAPNLSIRVDFFGGDLFPISSISEGQKSLVALALMLTLQDMNPGPICVFDEAHIFLDDSNKELISRLIKKTTERVQLIMLVPTTSHGFIKFADKIIGVVRPGMKVGTEHGGSNERQLGPSQVVELSQ